MIPVQEAVKKAVAFAEDMLEPSRTASILLEEVESAAFRGKDAWEITLSLRDPNPLSFAANRQYKTFTIDAETGEVLSMKIRQLSSTT